ncbi:hypothetical protein SAMN05444371_3411 [Epilithonimonas mollis]|uniref:Uncharacterized protein n=1 Tax=Epilithonimonas mollis TaxID=216903 RepID=A0A1M6UQ54_9FLAO|nr:hypothetical protein SAMN05444371_3411 [Epilithonimonas mollis]
MVETLEQTLKIGILTASFLGRFNHSLMANKKVKKQEFEEGNIFKCFDNSSSNE